jgi:hypothetical protein
MYLDLCCSKKPGIFYRFASEMYTYFNAPCCNLSVESSGTLGKKQDLPIVDSLPYNWVRTQYNIMHFQEAYSTMGGPALMIVDHQGIFEASLIGFILSLPVVLFLAYWISNVKRPMVVIIGAFIGGFLGFLIILGWVGTLIFDTVLPGATPGATFFGSLLFCSALGLSFGIIADLIVARLNTQDYRRPSVVNE